MTLPGASKAHGRLLDRWIDEALPDLPSYESIEAALASRQPGTKEDVALLEGFRKEGTGPDIEGRVAYLDARLLQRQGRPDEAAEVFAVVARESAEPEPHLRLAECFLATDRALDGKTHLRRVLEGPGAARAKLWGAWLGLALAEMSPQEVLDRFPRREDPYADDVRWLLEELDANGAIRIDCAATEEYSSASGLRWGRDRFFVGGDGNHARGTPWGRPTVIGIADERLYQTSRWFERGEYRPGYAIPLPRGEYVVTLHFCEGCARAPGVRVFDVLIEGETVLPGYDGFAFASAGFGVATSEDFDVTVEDGLLEIEFRVQKDRAAVAAIEVRPHE